MKPHIIADVLEGEAGPQLGGVGGRRAAVVVRTRGHEVLDLVGQAQPQRRRLLSTERGPLVSGV